MVNSSAQLDHGFGALAHPIRRAIVERLSGGPATVGATTSDLGVSKPAISRHLKVLEEAGVVTRSVEGRTHRLMLSDAALDEPAAWMERQRALWERKLDAVEEHIEARRRTAARKEADA